jgi:Uma2 family endonuclease
MSPVSPMASSLVTSTSVPLAHWQPATWADYLRLRDSSPEGSVSLFFQSEYLLTVMGEGINHSRFHDLLGFVFLLWFTLKSPQPFDSLSSCLLEKPDTFAASPDLVLYVGVDFPQWRQGESRYLNLKMWRVPDLVGEVGDTTIATDLDEKKHLYASLGIPEYWVADVKGARVIAFHLDEQGQYQQIDTSITLSGLPIELLSQALERLAQGEPNGVTAQWFAQQLANISR